MILHIHTHANGYYYQIRKREPLGEAPWIEQHLIPHHPYLPSERVNEYNTGLTPERFIKEMDEAGIDKAVIVGGGVR